MRKSLSLIILLATTIYAQELFYPYEIEKNSESKKITKSEIQHSSKDDIYAEFEMILTYQKIDSKRYKKYSSILDKYISQVSEDIKNINTTKRVSQMLEEAKEYSFNSRYNSREDISLFAITDKSISIKDAKSLYTGGAHGSYSEDFINYNIDTQKIINIDNIIKQSKTKELTKAVERYYKFIKRIPQDGSLVDYDGWFEDRFILPDKNNIAITNNGLYFYYPTYSLKAYSYGDTHILIPYYILYPYLNHSSIIEKIAKPKSSYHYQYDNQYAKMKVDTEVKKHKVILHIQTSIKSDDKKIYLSITTPQFHTNNIVSHYDKGSFQTINFYKKGAKIYDIEAKKAIKANYLLIELSVKNQKNREHCDIEFDIPKRFDEFLWGIRVTTNIKPLHSLPDYDGYIGEQHFYEFRQSVPLR